MSRIIWFMFLISLNTKALDRVRYVECQRDQIVSINTAIGIATLIQVPDRPSSIVIGDQDKFKVEYLDRAITIKPLQMDVKSNLYIYTDYRRFNVQLISGNQDKADYVVYLKNKQTKKDDYKNQIQWREYKRRLANEEVEIETKRSAVINNEVFILEFQITSKNKLNFKPEWIWVIQNSKVRPIHKLFLESLSLFPNRSVAGFMQLRLNDFNANEVIKLEIRRKKASSIILSLVKL